MGLLSDLESGEVGVRCHLGSCGTKLRESDSEACVQDVANAVLWTCERSPWRTDLGPETLQLLRFDVQRHARGLFEAVFEPHAGQAKPKTSDPDWSPLIEAQTQMFGGRVLRLVHRTRYEPDNEVVEARVVIPTSSGTVTISAVASADETGERERAAAAKQRATSGSAHPPGRSLQSVADDVAWDDEFPEHPLSRVRAALSWLTDPKAGGLEVLAPETQGWTETVVLEEASSIISAPTRFLRVPLGAIPRPHGMGVLSRVVFGGDERPRTVEVWRVDAGRVARDFGARLQQVADERTLSWAAGGVSEIETKTMSANATDMRAELIRYVRYKDGSGSAHAMQCWFTDADGTIFRVEAAGPRYAPANDLWEDMAQVTRSWKRIAEATPSNDAAPVSEKKRWWSFW